MPEIFLPPDDAHVDGVLAAELPKTQALIRPTRYAFDPSAGDLVPGPLGPSQPIDPSKIRPGIPIIPRAAPYRFGTLKFLGAPQTLFPLRLTVEVPSIVCIYDWDTADPGNASGLPILMYAPAENATPPDFTDTIVGSPNAWQSGWGPIAFLPSAGDWWLVTFFELAAVTPVVSAFMVIDATNPAMADAWCRDFSRRPNQSDGSLSDGAGGGHFADFVIPAATSTLVLNDNSFLRTAITVQNVGAGSLRMDFGTGAATVGPTTGYSIPGSANGSPIITFQGPTLLEGDMWAYSAGGTSLQLRVYGQTNWKNL